MSPRCSEFRCADGAPPPADEGTIKNRAGRADNPAPKTQTRLDATLTARILCCRSRRLRLHAGLFLPRLGPRGRWRQNWPASLDLAYSTLSDLAWLVIKLKCGLAM